MEVLGMAAEAFVPVGLPAGAASWESGLPINQAGRQRLRLRDRGRDSQGASAGADEVASGLAVGVIAALAGLALPAKRVARGLRRRVQICAGALEDMPTTFERPVDWDELTEDQQREYAESLGYLEVLEAEQNTLDDESPRPRGKSTDPDQVYFWKMSKDKRTIDVIVPVEDWVKKEHVVYRMGEDCEDPKRGPEVELGFRYTDTNGKMREKLIVDGQLLNAVNTRECYWVMEDMADVRCIVLTLRRPSMMRTRHDPYLQSKRTEERLEPQTWDALLVKERKLPDVTDRVYLDISLEGKPAGRLVFGLYGGVVPRTVKNFIGLVTGEYEDDEGQMQKSAHCLKGTCFSGVWKDYVMAAGNPGLDFVKKKLSPDELKEYAKFFQDFSVKPKAVGDIKAGWALRFGLDLGLFKSEKYGERMRREGEAISGNDFEELTWIKDRMEALVEKGEGAELLFFRPEYEKGCDVTGGMFPAESFEVPHFRRGQLSMDRNEDSDTQGSLFFVTLKEFPEMDKRWVAFGEVIEGMELVEKIESEYEGLHRDVIIKDCGVLE